MKKIRNIFNKTVSFLLAAVSAAVLFSGCNNDIGVGIVEKIDSTRTQLYVANYNGGLGNKWLRNLKEKFEEACKDKVYEEGRKGVQLIVDDDKSYLNSSIIKTIKSSHNEIFFPGGEEDNLVEEFLDEGLLLEITDIVKENLKDKYGEDGTIEAKLTPTQIKEYSRDGKYYVLPHTSTYLGVVYDVDLFNEQKLYFKEGGGWTGLDGNRSKGPDALPGTFDDGLPATYDEFFSLCRYMNNTKNIKPLSWTGAFSASYSNFLTKALWADYQGKEEASLQFNVGTVPESNSTYLVTGFNGDVPVLSADKVVINESNYKELAKQPGRYYALKFWEEIIKNEYFYSPSTSGSQSHVMAQADFMGGKFRGTPIAMLIEGTWWENEAKDAGSFSDLASIYGEEASQANRKFGFMPMPKVEGREGTPATYYGGESVAFINSNIQEFKKQLAKDFLQFIATDEALNIYTLETGLKKAYKYQITTETYDKLSYFSKSLIDALSSGESLEPVMASNELKRTLKKSTEALMSSYTKITVNNQYQARTVFFNALWADNVSAKSYFEGIYRYLSEDI